MKKIPTADKFFDSVDYVSIIDTVKGIFTSDGSMALLLDYERVLDEADLYAFKNWELGELVQGPTAKRYSVGCIFLWPYKLMPDPRGAKRLLMIGCKVRFKLTKIRVPVIVKDYDDFVPGTRYPKWDWRKVWLVSIEMPRELMDDIKEGSIDLAGQTIDLQDLEDSYDDDLQKEDSDGTEDGGQNEQQEPGMADLGAPAPLGAPPAPAM